MPFTFILTPVILCTSAQMVSDWEGGEVGLNIKKFPAEFLENQGHLAFLALVTDVKQ